jgi:hypothetical protein
MSLTIPATSASVERAFSALKEVHTYLSSTQTRERLIELPLIGVEKKILQDLENSLNFCDYVIDIFTEKNNFRMEVKYIL